MPLRTVSTVVLLLSLTASLHAQQANMLKSPDGKLGVEVKVNGDRLVYVVHREGRPVLQESRLGLVREDEDFSRGLKLIGQSAVEPVEDKYELLTSKRRQNVYQASRQVYHLQSAGGKKMDVIFQASNDGVAFRYHFPETSNQVHKLREEVTSFHFLPGTLAWLQPMSGAKTGWAQTNPSYEEYYRQGIPAGTPSPLEAGWVYPALFRSGDTWLLISETGLGRNYCGTRLRHESPNGEYSIGFADPKETMNDGPVNPESKLPWSTPWRVIVVGSLKTITESTLGTDLADKPAVAVDPAAIKPGKSSWSWVLLGDRRTTYEVQKSFIDYAADMGWEYCLIDALWDKQIGYDRVKELADYAATKNVGVLVWYNSAGPWNTANQTPRDKMLTRESRLAEFEKLKAMGIKGLKVDFFGGDGQAVINYYHDILEDSAPFGFMMNFHGSTLPRGWHRTYPHLMTMEAIKGFEFITFEQANANEEPAHAAMMPFTRNVFDPMDFTPVALDRINNRIRRRTTPAFQLATAVLYTSGIQHYAEIPEGMAKMPDYVKEFMKHVPIVWDDVKLIDGDPGKHAVIARKANGRWYVAGVNGEAVEKKLSLDLSELTEAKKGSLITDAAAAGSFENREVTLDAGKKLDVTVQANGGFVVVFE